MAKAQEKLIVSLDYTSTEMAFRKAAASFGTIREMGNGHFVIKETDNGYSAGTLTMGDFGMAFSTDKTTNPSTIDIFIRSISPQQTEIDIHSTCFGFGPIQNNHCKSKLSTVKSAIMVAVSEYAKQAVAPTQTTIANTTPVQDSTVNETLSTSPPSETTIPNQQNISTEPLIVVQPIVKQNHSSTFKIIEITALVLTSLSLLLYVLPIFVWFQNPTACYIIQLIIGIVALSVSIFAFTQKRSSINKLLLLLSAILVSIFVINFIYYLSDFYYSNDSWVLWIIGLIICIAL